MSNLLFKFHCFFFFFKYKIEILLYPNLNLYVCETPFRKLELRPLPPTPSQALIKFITSTILLIKFITSYQSNYNNKIIEHVSIRQLYLKTNSNQLLTTPLDKGTTSPITHTFIHVASHLHLLFLMQDIHAIHAKLMMLILIIILSLLKPRISALHTCSSYIKLNTKCYQNHKTNQNDKRKVK